MSNLFKNVETFVKKNPVVFLLGVLVLGIAIHQYSSGRGRMLSGFSNTSKQNKPYYPASESDSSVQAANPLGENSNFGSASGISTTANGLPPSCQKEPIADPASLLPKDENSEWARLNPAGKGELGDVNMLNAGHHIGIDTVGQSLRNANLQLRSEPANPQVNVGPWNQTTMSPDLMRVPLELGAGPQ